MGENTRNGLVSKFDIITLKIRALQRKNCVVVRDPKEKPEVFDIFGEVRPVLQLHATDSLAKKDVLCDQIVPTVEAYYRAYCEKVAENEAKNCNYTPTESQEAVNRADSEKLNSMIMFNLEEDA